MEDGGGKYENLSDFLDHVKLGNPTMGTVMLHEYAKVKFMSYICENRDALKRLNTDRNGGVAKGSACQD